MTDDEEIKEELLSAGVALNKAMERAREAGIDVEMRVVDFGSPPPRQSTEIDLTAWGVFQQLVVYGERTKTTSAW